MALKLNDFDRYETSGIIVEAIQYKVGNINNISDFITYNNFDWDALEIGDYIVNNLTSQFYICKKERFKMDYKKVVRQFCQITIRR
jgi:hypothetical protein